VDHPESGTDDTPTIISKNPPAAGSPNPSSESFNNSLRGRTLAHFELIEPVGVGGMAAVIRALDKQLDRIVALKILPPEMAGDPENVRRFHNEARAAAKLDHENIARVFFCGEDQRLHFIAFEFVEGVNLRAFVERRGRLPVAEAVHYMIQIASGLAHAAERGVVHRDIKPSNIIISSNGRAKLVDMGLARSLERRDDQALTQSGVTLGTFDYISPEQALEPRDADVRSDIYSLGCTFYHMLTGQPPVPDGTAAKKLHHHQHVAPIDPRQLNPEIPDDVAALLARMMAKDPKDRYQRPEHVVQHLLQVAQKIGVGAETPTGVLFVDAPLPNPPQRRPVLVASLAAVGLAIVLIALSFAPRRQTSSAVPNRAQIDAGETGPGAIEAPDKAVTKPLIKSAAKGGKRHVTDEEGLRQVFAADSPDDLPVAIDQTIELSGIAPVFRGKSGRTLRIESNDPSEPRKLRLKYKPGPEQPPLWAGLIVEGGKVIFSNLHFEIEAEQTPDNVQVAAVAVRSSGHVTFEKCTFFQRDAPVRPFLPQRDTLIPLASVLVENHDESGNRPPAVVFNECYFKEGQDAIVADGPVDVSQHNCAFGKHSALFHLRGSRNEVPCRVRLSRCSAFVVRGPAFRVDGEATCHLSVSDSIFSCPEDADTTSLHDELHLIRQTDSLTPAVTYVGERNCFHRLNALWVLARADGSGRIITDWPAFTTQVEKANGRDEGSTLLDAKVNPWKSKEPLREENPAVAFQVNTELREVRAPDLKQPLGLLACAWGKEYARDLPPLLSERPAEPVALRPNQKVVDPDAAMSTAKVYRNLTGALEDAKPGDEILIKQRAKSRLVEVSPVRLLPDLSVTIKPFPDHHPILTLAATADDEDSALFRLNSGQLSFENLEFSLKPDKKGFKAQTVVALKGNGQCAFRQCVVTLAADEGAASGVHLSVVTLLDTRDAMKMPVRDPRPAPKIQMENCFVHGEGECLTVRASRPFDLDVENCIVALAGSLVNVEGGAADPGLASSARIKLERVTTYLTDHLVQLRASRNGKVLTATTVSAVKCLFAAAGGNAFIHLDGPDTEKQMKELFFWEGGHNAYDGFEKLLAQQAAGDKMVVLRYDEEKWRMFANESDPQPLFLQTRCFDLGADRSLAQTTLEDFRVKTELRGQLSGYGATLAREASPRVPAAETSGSELGAQEP
jgi:serine/threonine protein kinase